MHPAIKKGNVAVVTGSSYGGIGFAVVRKLSSLGLKVCLADISQEYLELGEQKLIESGVKQEDIMISTMDVTKPSHFQDLVHKVFSKWHRVDVLHLNAGVAVRAAGKAWENPEAWHTTLNVNLWGIINGAQAFVPKMLEAKQPGLVICTGSKQGITCPPGNSSYNVSKAGVKAFTEQLAHELRNEGDGLITAALLVPGYVHSKLTSNNASTKDSEPPKGAWTPEQTVDYMFDRLEKKDFYIICPDADVTEAMDRGRMRWSFDDVLERRPALSRWHPEYKRAFDDHMKRELQS